jgi:hypothetical protein
MVKVVSVPHKILTLIADAPPVGSGEPSNTSPGKPKRAKGAFQLLNRERGII